MTETTTKASATFSILDLTTFKQQVVTWASKYKVACHLDHNTYQGHLYNDFEALVAVGVEDEIYQTSEAGAFEQLKIFRDKNNGWLFGFLTYDLKNDVENLRSENFDGLGFPALHFFCPKFVLEISEAEVIIHSQEKAPSDIFNEISTVLLETTRLDIFAPQKLKARVSKEEYLDTISTIRRHIRQGDIYEMNFCQEFFAEGCQLSPVSAFLSLNQIAKAPFSAFYKLHDQYLMCASPERFLKKEGKKLISQPIKGTIRRGQSKMEDEQLRQQLFRSTKDRSENVMIVDLVRNDLSRSCKAGSVKVEELFGTYPFEQVHQLTSTVVGKMREGVHSIDAIKLAFPMGSMTGAPKFRSMQLIEKYEKTKRGLYSGAVGYFRPNGDFDLNVVIRSMLYNSANQYLSMQVGGAIVYASNPVSEYEECLLKAKGMFSVLGLT